MLSPKLQASLSLNHLLFRLKGVEAYCGNVRSKCRQAQTKAQGDKDILLSLELDKINEATKDVEKSLQELRTALKNFRIALYHNIDGDKSIG